MMRCVNNTHLPYQIDEEEMATRRNLSLPSSFDAPTMDFTSISAPRCHLCSNCSIFQVLHPLTRSMHIFTFLHISYGKMPQYIATRCLSRENTMLEENWGMDCYHFNDSDDTRGRGGNEVQITHPNAPKHHVCPSLEMLRRRYTQRGNW